MIKHKKCNILFYQKIFINNKIALKHFSLHILTVRNQFMFGIKDIHAIDLTKDNIIFLIINIKLHIVNQRQRSII
jgi:hypothetical protein